MIQTFIFGGYTRRLNKGLHQANFNSQTGEFQDVELIAELQDPTFFALNTNKDRLFVIEKGDNQGGLATFKRIADNQWVKTDLLFASTMSGCHVAYRESSQTIYVSNYHEGQIDIYQLIDDKLNHIQVVKHKGSSIHLNQTQARVHFTTLDQAESRLFACDLGSDTITIYHADDQGKLTLASTFAMPAGTGPRHLTIHPNEKYLYVIGELNCTTNVLSLNRDNQLSLLETHHDVENISSPNRKDATGAAIRLTSDGRHLYTSTRYTDTISVYQVSETGDSIQLVNQYDTVGQVPRDFNFDETETYIVVAHQDSDHLSVFSRDTNTGKLTFNNNNTAMPECVCVAHL